MSSREVPVFTVLNSERVFEGKIARVRVDEVSMPGGGSAKREVVEHDRAVAIVALDEENNVLLVEQYRHPFRRRLWELPAGLLDIAGEPPRVAAARELAEEIGYAAQEWQVLVDVAASPGFTDEAVRVFLARGLSIIGRQGEITDEEADLKLVHVPLAVAVAAVMNGDIINGATVSGILSAHIAIYDGLDLRDADDPWVTGPAVPRDHHEEVGDAGGIIASAARRD